MYVNSSVTKFGNREVHFQMHLKNIQITNNFTNSEMTKHFI